MPGGGHPNGHPKEELVMNEKANPNFRSPAVSGYALVVNGHSLIHALSPSMEQLFLSVAEHCSGEALV